MDKVFLIGNAHLDPVWQWCYSEGLALVKSTFKAALDRMEEYPEFVFTSACAAYYEWIKETEPEMFEKIKQRVKEGRWKITGGMYIQPDCNIPSGESFARQLLYSQRFFKENFGFAPKTGYNVDSFGHNGMLPQLLVKSGIENYIYQRPDAYSEKPEMTKEPLHYWQSPDGSRVLCWHMPTAYCCNPENENESPEKQTHYGYPALYFYGAGNHGGGPTIRAINALEKIRKESDLYVYSGPDEYFYYVREKINENNKNNKENNKEIPVVNEDLQHHASGCYSANSMVKYLNRRAEEALTEGEKTDVLSCILTGGKSLSGEIKRGWKRLMFNQFHDILAGCSIKPAYEDAYDGMRAAALCGNEVKNTQEQRISWKVNTTKNLNNAPSEQRDRIWVAEGQGSPVVVFNPHSFPVKTIASIYINNLSGIRDADDNDVPMQSVRGPYTDWSYKNECIFEAELEPYGYRTYFVYSDENVYKMKYKGGEIKTSEDAGKISIENSVIKLSFDCETGAISEFTCKKSGENYAGEGFGRCIVIENEESDTWAHKIVKFDKKIGEFKGKLVKLTEKGPIRAAVRVYSEYENATLIQDYSICKGSGLVSVKAQLNFNEKLRILKLCFPVSLKEELKPCYSMPYGFIEKKANGEEEPAQKWVILTGKSGRGISVINKGKYSYCAENNELRIVIARTCCYLDHYGQNDRDEFMQYEDMGQQEFEYGFNIFDGCISDTVKNAEVFNMPVTSVKETHHAGPLQCDFSGINIEGNVIISAIKYSEDGAGYVIRAYETEGKNTFGKINLKFIDRIIETEFKPQEIKTFYIPFNRDECIKEINITEI